MLFFAWLADICHRTPTFWAFAWLGIRFEAVPTLLTLVRVRWFLFVAIWLRHTYGVYRNAPNGCGCTLLPPNLLFHYGFSHELESILYPRSRQMSPPSFRTSLPVGSSPRSRILVLIHVDRSHIACHSAASSTIRSDFSNTFQRDFPVRFCSCLSRGSSESSIVCRISVSSLQTSIVQVFIALNHESRILRQAELRHLHHYRHRGD